MSKNYMQTDQMAHNAALSQISTNPPADGREIGDIFTNINKRVTDPFSLTIAGLVLTVGSSIVDSGPDGKKRGVPQLDAVDLGDLNGTFDFSAGPGGAVAATGDCVATTAPAMTSNYVMRVGIETRSDKKIYLVFGNEGANESSAGAPPFSEGVLQAGEILLQEDGAGGFVSHTDQSGVTQFGTGSGGGGSGTGLGNINYVVNFKGDIDVNNWVTYNDGAATPVDGVGGTVDGGFTLTKTETDPLRGKGSFLITKPASDVVGHGISTPLKPIDVADRGRLLDVSFDFEVASGTYANDLGVWLYDIDNTTLISPYGQSIVGDGKGRARFQFKAPANAENLRLIIHQRTTSADAYTIKLDLISVGPIFPTESTKKLVNEAHTFAVGDIVWFTATGWEKASALPASYRRDVAPCMVIEVIDSDNFVVLERGFFRLPSGSSFNNPGEVFYLSETAGEVTTASDQQIVSPLALGGDQNEGYFDPKPARRVDPDEVISFALSRFGTGSEVILQGGEIQLDNGQTIVSGNGTTETGVGVNITLDLDTILGASPADNTTYCLYIDRYALSEQTLTDSGRTVLQAFDNSDFYLSTSAPSEVNPYRYIFVGVYHSADSGNAWQGTGAIQKKAPTKQHDTTYSLLSVPQKKKIEITSVVNALYDHGLEGKPQLINAFYDDGTDIPVDATTAISERTETQLRIDSSAYVFGSGEKLIVEAVYFPELNKNLASVSGRYESSWITSSVASLAHNLSDGLDIAAITVIEHNTSTGHYTALTGNNSPVVDWDDTNIYLNWTGFDFTNKEYKVLTGGSPVPQAVPTFLGGFTKFVGYGPGSYATLAAAIADASPGDSILVSRSESLTSPVDFNINNIRVRFMPNVKYTFTSGVKGFILSGSGICVESPWVVMAITGAATAGIEISGDENFLEQSRVEANDAGMTLAAAYSFLSGADRNWLNGVVRTTAGTVTASLTDAGTDNAGYVRG